MANDQSEKLRLQAELEELQKSLNDINARITGKMPE